MSTVFVPTVPAFRTLITHCPITLELHGYKHWVADVEKIQLAAYRNRAVRAKYADFRAEGAERRLSAANNLVEAVEEWIERQRLNQ